MSAADWERVLTERRQEKEVSAQALRHLGPEVKPDQVIASTDEVLTRKAEKRRFWELRMARIATPQGYQFSAMICVGKKAKATLLGTLYYHLWRGQLDAALQTLTHYRPQAKLAEKLDELLAYLEARRLFIPDY